MTTAMRGMREGMKPVMWAVAAAFVLSLTFVGATTLRKIIRGEQQGPAVVIIDGRKVSQREFEEAFVRELRLRYRRYQQQNQKPLTEEAERDLRLATAGATLNKIVQEELISREAKRLGIRVTDEDVKNYLVNNPNFQVAGEFDAGVYKRWLEEQLGMTPGEFEEEIRKFILMDRVMAVVGDAARVSPAEARAQWEEDNEKVQVEYISLKPAAGLPTPPTDQQLKNYYTAHLERYRFGRRVKVKYFLIDLDEQRKKIKIPDTAVKEYYERHKTIHFDAGEIRCRHILFLVPPGSPESAWDEARRKAADAARRARAGEDFATLAKTLSEDQRTASRGGDLGFFARGSIDPDFEAAAFALREGQISDPVKSVYGYHVIKREADIPPFAEVKEDIRKELVDRRADEEALKLAQDLRAKWLEVGEEIDPQAEVLGLKPAEPEPFEADGFIVGLGRQPQLAQEAFTLDVGTVGSVIPVGTFDPMTGYRRRGYVVYKVVSKINAGPAPFANVRERILADYNRDAALDNVAKKAEEIAAAAKSSGDLKKTAAAAGAAYSSPVEFTRQTPPPDLHDEFAVVTAAFKTEAGHLAGPIRGRNGFYVLKVIKKTPPDPALFATQGEQYRAHLIAEKRNALLTEWYRDLVSRAKIVNNLSAFIREVEKPPAEREPWFNMPLSALGY